MQRFKYLACALALVAAPACGSSDTLTTPTQTNNVTIDFTDATNGPLTQNGSQTFQFAVLAAGQVSATLVDLEPDGPNSIVVGMSLGNMNSTGACATAVSNDHVLKSSFVAANATGAGTLCVRIYDPLGTLPRPQTFDILVSHP